MYYKYEKRCSLCNTVYYSKDISEDQFSNISDNPNITVSNQDGCRIAEIKSTCEECANKKD